jgi:hypothetical protein
VIRDLVLAAGEPSKVPFYIAGGALAVWAVVLATIGINRPTFATDHRGARAVMGVSFVLAAVAIAMAIITSAFIKP